MMKAGRGEGNWPKGIAVMREKHATSSEGGKIQAPKNDPEFKFALRRLSYSSSLLDGAGDLVGGREGNDEIGGGGVVVQPRELSTESQNIPSKS